MNRMKNKTYTAAPLPFRGQKRRFVKDLKRGLEKFGRFSAVVDLFGGSGILSHTAKRLLPDVRVVYNDFDHYTDRLAGIPTTNEILSRIRLILQGIGKLKRVPEELKARILETIRGYSERGYVDFITLGSSLTFSGRWTDTFEELANAGMWNKVREQDYDAEGYLEGLEVVHKDYRELFAEFRDDRDAVFLVDPPYLTTEATTYSNEGYWRLTDYLDVLNVLEESRYLYFTGSKSQIVELCGWINANTSRRLLYGAEILEKKYSLNYISASAEIMLAGGAGRGH